MFIELAMDILIFYKVAILSGSSVAVALLVEQSTPTPEISGSSPIIDEIGMKKARTSPSFL